MDSLRYWVTEMGVDGFRFDLAPTLARQEGGFDTVAAFFDLVWQDPVLAQVQVDRRALGRRSGWTATTSAGSPPGGASGTASSGTPFGTSGAATTVCCRIWRPGLAGSPDLYTRHRRGPDASINLITVHDGFTLADLVSYNDKHNEANTEHNRDGTSDNRSWNCGVEGPTDDPAIIALRLRQRRAMLTHAVAGQGSAAAARR